MVTDRSWWWIVRALAGLWVLAVCCGRQALCQESPALGAKPGLAELHPPRWRAVRQIVHLAAEQAHFRWAAPATISRRAFLGTPPGESAPAERLLQDLCRQTGLTCQHLNGLAVLHVPKDAELRDLSGKLAAAGAADAADAAGRLEAIWRLGWLQDARAWPAAGPGRRGR